MKPIILSFFMIIFFYSVFTDKKEAKAVAVQGNAVATAQIAKLSESDSIITKKSQVKTDVDKRLFIPLF